MSSELAMGLRRCILFALAAVTLVYAATFDVTVQTIGHAVPLTLYGLMFEDINHVGVSGDGGLYAELIMNHAFQQVTPVKSSTPVSSALPNALSLAVTSSTTGTVGFTNTGFFGIPVTAGWKYAGSFYYRFPTPPANRVSGSFTVDLRSTSGTVFTSTTVPFTSSAGWKKVTFSFTPSSTQTSVSNLFALSVNAATVSGLTMEFTLISLFPPTFNNRANGFRMDLSQALLDMKPAFFRFPGGNRYSLNGQSVAAGSLQQYITEAINQINFVIGSATSNAQGQIRAAMGYPNPFALNYIEIGNEDFFSPTTYADYRWADFYNALSAEFPQLNFIATSATTENVPSLSPAPKLWDLHIYSNPDFFINGAFNFDILARNGLKFFQGEYATTTQNSGASLQYPFIDGSIAEAAYMTGFDRNSDIVFAASYAPLLNHVSSTQWTPNLITFTYENLNDLHEFRVTVDLQAQLRYQVDLVLCPTGNAMYSIRGIQKLDVAFSMQLFSLYKGDTYLTSTTNTASSPIQWSATKNTAGPQVFLKVINTATTANTVVFTLPFGTISSAGTGTILTAASGTQNTLTNPNAAVPRNFTFTAGKTITYNASLGTDCVCALREEVECKKLFVKLALLV
ncbi:glycoside hydrolase family 51 protein [Collybiopsis luxurians FD-317 M1]|nr:glycoside hydrolase family 51 protein [Collybiopsis luxurians FD-317 M1]